MAEEIPPKTNIETYRCLFQIENVLRELIIDRLSRVVGPRWYKQRLPSDILKKYREGITYERGIPWIRLTPHHPTYYLDFPDLRKVIEREDNWRDAFKAIFVRKDILDAILGELEPIRNKVAHNRVATSEDSRLAAAAREALSSSIGPKRFSALASKCTLAKGIYKQLATLHRESEKCVRATSGCDALKGLRAWRTVNAQWWFDKSYLGAELDGIKRLFGSFEEYATLPRRRGTGHKIEKWVRERNIKETFESASHEFSELLKQWGHHDRSDNGS